VSARRSVWYPAGSRLPVALDFGGKLGPRAFALGPLRSGPMLYITTAVLGLGADLRFSGFPATLDLIYFPVVNRFALGLGVTL
jgi:hypothetical protein